MTTTVLLVRHGQTTSNVTGFYMGWSNEDLDDVGYAQVRSLSARLAGRPIAAVYPSPLQRTCSTAAAIAKPHGLEVKTLDDFIEIQLGDWQGLQIDEVRQRWPELWRQSRIDPVDITMPNGESFNQVTERAIRGFETVVAANQDRLAVIVTHDIVVRVLVAYVLGVTNSIYRRMEINNASLTLIRFIDGRARLLTLNDTSHIEPSPLF